MSVSDWDEARIIGALNDLATALRLVQLLNYFQYPPPANPQPGLLYTTNADGITATASGNQGNAFSITTEQAAVATVATAGDAVKLPASAPGLSVTVINRSGNPMQVFPAPGDMIDGLAANASATQMQQSVVTYFCCAAGRWLPEGLGTGYAGSFPTFSSADGLTAHSGGGQGSATPITTSVAAFGTVGLAGDSAVLPVSKPGMEITVINKTATSMNVFPASGENINGGSANAAVAVTNTAPTIFYCVTAGAWWTK